MSFVPRTLRCPSCNEMINESVTQCGFCSVPIDRGTAQLIADKQQRANKACSDASYLRTATIAMFVFLGLSVIPFIPLVTLAFDIVFIVVVVLVILWQVRYNGLIISDPDFEAAKLSWRTSLILMLVAAPLGFGLRPLIQEQILRLVAGE
jgi:hypothetical protein